MSLLESDRNAPNAWFGDLPVTSRYSFGIAGERFFREIKDKGHFFGTHCNECEHTYVPATLFCERCFSKLDEWVDLGNSGEIFSYTHLYQNYDGSERETPLIIIFVRIADGGIVHCLDEVSLDDIYIGMPVEAIFKSRDEREGSILDIKYFKPSS